MHTCRPKLLWYLEILLLHEFHKYLTRLEIIIPIKAECVILRYIKLFSIIQHDFYKFRSQKLFILSAINAWTSNLKISILPDLLAPFLCKKSYRIINCILKSISKFTANNHDGSFFISIADVTKTTI